MSYTSPTSKKLQVPSSQAPEKLQVSTSKFINREKREIRTKGNRANIQQTTFNADHSSGAFMDSTSPLKLGIWGLTAENVDRSLIFINGCCFCRFCGRCFHRSAGLFHESFQNGEILIDDRHFFFPKTTFETA